MLVSLKVQYKNISIKQPKRLLTGQQGLHLVDIVKCTKRGNTFIYLLQDYTLKLASTFLFLYVP